MTNAIFNAYYENEFIGEVSAPSSKKAEDFVVAELQKKYPARHPEMIRAFVQIVTLK